MEEKITPTFKIGDRVINPKVNVQPLTISKLGEIFYYTEEGILIPYDRQQDWKLYGLFKTGEEILIPGKIVRSSGNNYYITFPWAYQGTICTCFGDEWIVPKEEGDKLFIKQEENG